MFNGGTRKRIFSSSPRTSRSLALAGWKCEGCEGHPRGPLPLIKTAYHYTIVLNCFINSFTNGDTFALLRSSGALINFKNATELRKRTHQYPTTNEKTRHF